jgi:hypothetical protein
LEVVSDRRAIQRLKQNRKFEVQYRSLVKRNKDLTETWNNLIKELKRTPLFNSSRDIDNPELDSWWNSNGEEKMENPSLQKGMVHSLEDWPNMVEFWYAVRNNLFHGGKNPDVHRDHFIVEHAYKTLSEFMSLEISNIGFDLKRF